MDRLALHPSTKRQLAAFQTSPAHAMMIIGPAGSGKRTLAIELAQDILAIQDFSDYPYGMIIAAEQGKSIGIEATRQLEQFLSLKVPGKRQYDRVIIIEDAQQLTGEAQNALLKTLEEPPQGTLLILTVDHQQSLLPTIRSRVQVITLTRPEKTTLQDAFSEFDEAAFRQAYAISGGLPGLMHAMLHETEHPLMLATQYARQLLSKSAYERLLLVDELSKQRQLAVDVTFILQQMAHVSLQTAADAAALRWQHVLTASYETAEALVRSGQPKLALTNLMLRL